ncbi:ATP-dependent DNA helicase [Bordetella pertussis]|nr:ATP-dependent DNA helicase [Bordetella pertussis]
MLPLFEHLPKPPELPFDRARPIEPAAPRIDVVSRVRGLFS